ncbi:MAG: hypothetical protein IT472_06830 [Thermomonas sp.]|jgi:hypothetical protein|uniref:hypothetical protein n=1 Tax=Thermomonas sp. TaxID=1971895 RepID=UPI00261DB8E3|nr:hypothetical protein [Thermomonas sp.]MBV6413485.1 hypothetical protein [Xanthomonadales bacterium]MCC7096872.1 hypothetical protein [Thermomonas sp.]
MRVPRLGLKSLRRRLPRWLMPVLAILLLCQQVTIAAHLCSMPAPVTMDASGGCHDDMGSGDPAMSPDCTAHCADPTKHVTDAVALGVPPLPPMISRHALLVAAVATASRSTSDDPASRNWPRLRASTILLI